jgi:hypothetical protein
MGEARVCNRIIWEQRTRRVFKIELAFTGYLFFLMQIYKAF